MAQVTDIIGSIVDTNDTSKTFTVGLSGATSGTSITLVSNQTANRTIQLPNANTVLATTDTAQTLTNKSIDGMLNTVTNIDASALADGSIANSKLINSSITVNAGTGLGGGGVISLGGTSTIDLEDTTVTPGTYGSASAVSVISIDAQGRITSANSTSIAGAPPSGSAGGDLTGTYPNPTLVATGTAGTYGSATLVPTITTDTKGRITAVTTNAPDDVTKLPLAGGTMTGIIAMSNKKITGLANGTAGTDAVNLSQIPTSLPPSGSAGGDLTGTYPNPTLTTAGTAGTYGSATLVPIITTDTKGRVTTVTTAAPNDVTKLPLAGGTMLGVISMGSNKITGLANGTVSTDAAAFGQIPTSLPPSGAAGGDLTGTYPNPTLVVPVTAVKGGTGQTVYAVGDLLYANTTTTLARRAGVATGNALISGGVGVAPSWGKVGLTTHVSGILPIANGGTNSSTALSNNRIMVSTGGQIRETAALTNGQILIGSTGAAPVVANITAGSGITVTNAAGSITIASTGGSSGFNKLYTLTSNNSITFGTAEKSLMSGGSGVGSLSIPANTLAAGSIINFNIAGIMTVSSSECLLKITLGGVTLSTSSNSGEVGNFTNAPFTCNGSITIRTIGATGTAIGQCRLFINHRTNPDNVDVVTTESTTAGTINTTSALTVDTTVEWHLAGSSATVTNMAVWYA